MLWLYFASISPGPNPHQSHAICSWTCKCRITSSHSLTTVLFLNPNDVLSRILLFSCFSQAAYAKSCRQDSYRNGGLLACKILKRPRPCSSAQSKLTSLSWTNWRCSTVVCSCRISCDYKILRARFQSVRRSSRLRSSRWWQNSSPLVLDFSFSRSVS